MRAAQNAKKHVRCRKLKRRGATPAALRSTGDGWRPARMGLPRINLGENDSCFTSGLLLDRCHCSCEWRDLISVAASGYRETRTLFHAGQDRRSLRERWAISIETNLWADHLAGLRRIQSKLARHPIDASGIAELGLG